VARSLNVYTSSAILRPYTTVLEKAFVMKLCRWQQLNVFRMRKVPDIFPGFKKIWNFLTNFRISPQYQISRKSVQGVPR
jgi:hypothetical protein